MIDTWIVGVDDSGYVSFFISDGKPSFSMEWNEFNELGVWEKLPQK